MIFGYVRVSSDGQVDGTSPAEQERKCRAIASLRGVSGYDFQLFRDDDVSGKIPLAERPAGAEMLVAARKGDLIVASRLDRMFRNTVDALQSLQEFKKRGIDLILTDLSAEPITGEGVGKLVFGLMAMFADFERDRINVRTQEGRRAKKAKGGCIGGLPPYGYRTVGSGKAAMLVPNETEQEAVRLIIELSKRSRPYRVSRLLAEQGHLDRLGRPFSVIQIKRTLAYYEREKQVARA